MTQEEQDRIYGRVVREEREATRRFECLSSRTTMPNALLVYPEQPPTFWGADYALEMSGIKADISASGAADRRRDVSSALRAPRGGLERERLAGRRP